MKLRDCGDHGLAAGLIDVPGIDAAGVDFGDGPGQRVLANAFGENESPLGIYFLGVVEADDAARGTEDYRCGYHRAEQRSAACFVESGDAQPAALSRFAFVTPASRAVPRSRILAQARLRAARPNQAWCPALLSSPSVQPLCRSFTSAVRRRCSPSPRKKKPAPISRSGPKSDCDLYFESAAAAPAAAAATVSNLSTRLMRAALPRSPRR